MFVHLFHFWDYTYKWNHTLAAGSWGSWSWCQPTGGQSQGPGNPRASASPLIAGAGPQGLWLQGLDCPRVDRWPALGMARAQGVLGLVPMHWWVRPGLRLVLAHWWVKLGPRISGCEAQGSQSWCQPTNVWCWVMDPLVFGASSQGSWVSGVLWQLPAGGARSQCQ